MYPVLATIGPVTIYSFGLLLAIGLLFATYYVWKHGRLATLSEEKLLDATFLTIFGGLIGARLLYVLSNWAVYSGDIFLALSFWRGGLSFWGALIGGIITLLVVAKKLHWPAGQLFDLGAPALALGAAFGYIGAFLNGTAYGAETDLPWGVSLQGIAGTRHPTQILEALLQLVLFIFLLRIKKQAPFAGFLAMIYLIFYSLGRFLLEFLRGDQTSFFGPFSQAHLLSFLVGTVAFLLLYLRLARLQGSWRVNIWKPLTPPRY